MSDAFGSLARDLGSAFRSSSGEPWPDDVFESWARRVFAYQFETNPTYSAFASQRGVTPSTLERWTEIPWVPASAFKALPLISGEASRVERVFRTSGTTAAGSRGEHHVLDLDLYRDSSLPNMRHRLYGAGSCPILVLAPDPMDVPESSLSFMLGIAFEVLSERRGGFFVTREGSIDTGGLTEALQDVVARRIPIVLAGTAFAFVHWLDWLKEVDRRFELPEGSLIMETGGFKGRSRVLDRKEFYESLSELHAVPVDAIVNEYGMTELLSQFYDRPARPLEARRQLPPPWVRTRVLDPHTLAPLPTGECGLLCHFDLANAGSVMAVLTEDMGMAFEDGFQVMGRAVGAEPRGCSLAMDELLSGRSV